VILRAQAETFVYEIGEEVVVRLEDVDLMEVEQQALIPRALLPTWTIGRITSFVTGGERPSYLLSTELRELNCICVVDEEAIEGLA
jgi:hypothetical protein